MREFGGGVRYRLSYLSALKLLPRSKVGTSTAYCTHLVGRRSRSPRMWEDIGLGALVSVSQVPLVAEERGMERLGDVRSGGHRHEVGVLLRRRYVRGLLPVR